MLLSRLESPYLPDFRPLVDEHLGVAVHQPDNYVFTRPGSTPLIDRETVRGSARCEVIAW